MRIADHQPQALVTTFEAPAASLTTCVLVRQISDHRPQHPRTTRTAAAPAPVAWSSMDAASSPGVVFTSDGSEILAEAAFEAMVGLSVDAAMML